jgi:RNA polymerase-binding transcription factor
VSDRDFSTIKDELQRRRRRILEVSRRADAELDALRSAERDPEFEEGAQSEHEQYTLARLGETQRRELAQIDAALARIEAGEYGLCKDCDQEIDPRRLAALPYALLCTECASRRERSEVLAQEPPTT